MKDWLKTDSGTCNISSRNEGMSWFCIVPQGFHCEDVNLMVLGYSERKNLPITTVEKAHFRYQLCSVMLFFSDTQVLTARIVFGMTKL